MNSVIGSPATSCAACAALTHTIKALEAEIAQLVAQIHPSCYQSPASGR
jgi:hypothetical protein